MRIDDHPAGPVFALKILNKEALVHHKQVNHAMFERTALENLDHPFIVKL